MCYFPLLLIVFSSSVPAATGLCLDQEQVIFHCETDRASKWLSVCAANNMEGKEAFLQYRFGTPGKIELVFPEHKHNSINQFRYSHYFRYQVDREELSFDRQGYSYSVFHDYEGDSGPPETFEGVIVTRSGSFEAISEIRCKKPAINRLHTLEAIVPCDRNDDLGGCER